MECPQRWYLRRAAAALVPIVTSIAVVTGAVVVIIVLDFLVAHLQVSVDLI